MLKYRSSYILLLLILLVFQSCKTDYEPINYGQDECDFCRMLITDKRFGSEIINDKGKVLKFDEVGCMIEYAIAKNYIGDTSQRFLVTDLSEPETFINATSALFIENENFRSPMGLNVCAFGDEAASQKFLSENGGNKFNWIELIELVKQRSM